MMFCEGEAKASSPKTHRSTFPRRRALVVFLGGSLLKTPISGYFQRPPEDDFKDGRRPDVWCLAAWWRFAV